MSCLWTWCIILLDLPVLSKSWVWSAALICFTTQRLVKMATSKSLQICLWRRWRHLQFQRLFGIGHNTLPYLTNAMWANGLTIDSSWCLVCLSVGKSVVCCSQVEEFPMRWLPLCTAENTAQYLLITVTCRSRVLLNLYKFLLLSCRLCACIFGRHCETCCLSTNAICVSRHDLAAITAAHHR